MGTILASTIIGRARVILRDEDSADYTWTDAYLLGVLNDGQRATVLLKPDSNVTNSAVQLAAGTKQTIPTGGIHLVKVTRNMGSAGTTAGKPIHLVDMEQMGFLEDFHDATASPIVESYMYDDDDPTHFYVDPPQPATPYYIEMVYTSNPTDIATTATAISLNDVYQGALLNYLLFRAYAIEDDANSKALSDTYYNLFLADLGMKTQAEPNPRTKQ